MDRVLVQLSRFLSLPAMVRQKKAATSDLVSFYRFFPCSQFTYSVLDNPNAVIPPVPQFSPRQQRVKETTTSGPDNLLVLPKLSLNGVPKTMPESPYQKSFFMSEGTESDETKARKRELNGHETTYPGIDSPLSLKPESSSSPVIPLSPDPFARFSSSRSLVSTSQASTSFGIPLPQHSTKDVTLEMPPERRSSRSPHSREVSITNPVDPVEGERPPSSRFSLDSTDEGKNNQSRVSLNAVKSIKSLWKKGRKASISFTS